MTLRTQEKYSWDHLPNNWNGTSSGWNIFLWIPATWRSFMAEYMWPAIWLSEKEKLTRKVSWSINSTKLTCEDWSVPLSVWSVHRRCTPRQTPTRTVSAPQFADLPCMSATVTTTTSTSTNWRLCICAITDAVVWQYDVTPNKHRLWAQRLYRRQRLHQH